jgi:GntR family transcriptional regulator, transcriptional repressor for pyruvate dehydrogenase complex
VPLDLLRIKKKAISESVAEQLRTAILRGEVEVGERLPPERQLAPRFGTNRNTLREAIRSLEAQGLVVARQGDGVRVTDFRTSGELSLLPDLLRIAEGEQRNRMVRDVLVMRRRMATEVASLSAERATDEQVDRLERLLDQQREHGGDLLLTMQTDLKIYGTMVEAADSLVVTLLFVTLNKLVTACVELIPALLYVRPDYIVTMSRVIAAIRARDPEGAGAALDGMLEETDEILVRRLAEFS